MIFDDDFDVFLNRLFSRGWTIFAAQDRHQWPTGRLGYSAGLRRILSTGRKPSDQLRSRGSTGGLRRLILTVTDRKPL
jgi:hypothetical protein